MSKLFERYDNSPACPECGRAYSRRSFMSAARKLAHDARRDRNLERFETEKASDPAAPERHFEDGITVVVRVPKFLEVRR